jgi:hypothetical protein
VHAEIVPLGILQNRAPAGRLVHFRHHLRTRRDQLHHVSRLVRPRIDVEVHPVLRGLALRHLLEVDPRPLPLGVDQRRLVVPALLRQVDLPPELLPRLEPLGRRLRHVTQRQRPELGQLSGVVRVEHDLDPESHARDVKPNW